MIVVRVWSRIYGEEVGDQVLKFLPSALFVTGEMALANLSPEDPFPPSSQSLSSSSPPSSLFPCVSSQSSQSSSNPLLQVFLEGYLSKKAMEMVVERTPVFLVRADELGLRGADLLGCQILTTASQSTASSLSEEEEESVQHNIDQTQGNKEDGGEGWKWYAMISLPLSLSLLLLLVMRRK